MPKTFPVVNTYSMAETIRSHVVDSTTTIYGFADCGTSTSAAKWKMFKVVDDATDMSQTWADGDSNYDNIWDNYASEIFS